MWRGSKARPTNRAGWDGAFDKCLIYRGKKQIQGWRIDARIRWQICGMMHGGNVPVVVMQR